MIKTVPARSGFLFCTSQPNRKNIREKLLIRLPVCSFTGFWLFLERNKQRMTWKTFTFLVLLVLLIVFTVQNHILINLRFFTWELIDVPLVYVLLFGLIFGFLLASIMQLPRILKLRRELKRVVKELEESEKITPSANDDDNPEGVSMGSDYEGGFFNEK